MKDHSTEITIGVLTAGFISYCIEKWLARRRMKRRFLDRPIQELGDWYDCNFPGRSRHDMHVVVELGGEIAGTFGIHVTQLLPGDSTAPSGMLGGCSRLLEDTTVDYMHSLGIDELKPGEEDWSTFGGLVTAVLDRLARRAASQDVTFDSQN